RRRWRRRSPGGGRRGPSCLRCHRLGARDRALRSRALLELAQLFEARAPELSLMLTRENGKTLAEATLEVGAPAAMLRHSAAQALTEVGIAAEVAPGRYFSSVAEPVGVVAISVPWNSPVALFSRSRWPLAPSTGPA